MAGELFVCSCYLKPRVEMRSSRKHVRVYRGTPVVLEDTGEEREGSPRSG